MQKKIVKHSWIFQTFEKKITNHPVGFVQLGPDEKVEVGYFVVFPDQCGGEAQLAVGLHLGQDSPELHGRHRVHLDGRYE